MDCPKCKRSMVHGTLSWYCMHCDVVISRREIVRSCDIRRNENE